MTLFCFFFLNKKQGQYGRNECKKKKNVTDDFVRSAEFFLAVLHTHTQIVVFKKTFAARRRTTNGRRPRGREGASQNGRGDVPFAAPRPHCPSHYCCSDTRARDTVYSSRLIPFDRADVIPFFCPRPPNGPKQGKTENARRNTVVVSRADRYGRPVCKIPFAVSKFARRFTAGRFT